MCVTTQVCLLFYNKVGLLQRVFDLFGLPCTRSGSGAHGSLRFYFHFYFIGFQEQIRWAVEESCDFVVAETFSTLNEALLALRAIKEFGNGKWPLN